MPGALNSRPQEQRTTLLAANASFVLTMLPPDDVLSRCAARPYARSPGRNLAGTLDGLRIQICGTLAITLGELVVTEAQLGGRQGRRLWTYLVLNRAPGIGRDELAGAGWGAEQTEAREIAPSGPPPPIRVALSPGATRPA